MSGISEVVDTLEKRINRLIESYRLLQQERSDLIEQIEQLEEGRKKAVKQVEQLQTECETLKLANSMLGSNQYTRETKLKINALVRELDNCITQLSE